MLVSSISGYVDILLETVRSLGQNVEIPHFEDGEDVSPLLCDQLPHPDKDVAVQSPLASMTYFYEFSIYTLIFLI